MSSDVVAAYQLTQEKLDKAQALKDKGNIFFQQKQYERAKRKYHEALLQVRVSPSPMDALMGSEKARTTSDEELVLNRRADSIRAVCYSNLAGKPQVFRSSPVFIQIG